IKRADDRLRDGARSRLLALLPCGDQGVWANPGGVGVLRRKYCDQVELLTSGIDESVRHACRNLCHVGRLDHKCLVADPVLSCTFKQNMRLFGVMYMQSWTTT